MGGDPNTLLYASPTGDGDGTQGDPYSFLSAIAAAQDGCTIKMLEGTYTLTERLVISKAVTIEPDGDVIIDGFLFLDAAATIRDITFFTSGFTDRTSTQETAAPTDLSVSAYAAITVDNPGGKVINCTIHDTPHGILINDTAKGSEIYGNVIYFPGWISPLQASCGHGIYPANDGASLGDTLTIQNNIVLHTYAFGIVNYGTTQNYILTKNNIVSRSGDLANNPKDNLLQSASHTEGKDSTHLDWVGNCTYGNQNEWGYGGDISGALTDNYLSDGIIKTGTPTSETGNVYAPEEVQKVFVFPNAYKSGRAHIACFNWTNANTIEADLSAVTGLNAGDTVNVWNVQAGIGNDVQVLTLDANKKIIVNMQAVNRSVGEPIGTGWTAPATTFPTFGAFVVEQV